MRTLSDSKQINSKAPLQIRLSPDGLNVAIRNRDSKTHPWRVSNGGYYRDDQVEGWHPMVGISPDDRIRLVYALVYALRREDTLQLRDNPEVAEFVRLLDFFGNLVDIVKEAHKSGFVLELPPLSSTCATCFPRTCEPERSQCRRRGGTS
jgi:hypothetical protein